MRELNIGLVAALRELPVCLSSLAKFGGYPAVFTVFPAPRECEVPYVRIAGITDNDLGTKNGRHRDLTVDIDVFDDINITSTKVDAVAEGIREALHKKPHSVLVSGYTVSNIAVSGPINIDDTESQGRTLSVQITIYK